MPALLKGAVAILVAAVTSLTTVATLGHVHRPELAATPVHRSVATTEVGDVPAWMFASVPAPPAPTPETWVDPGSATADAVDDGTPATAPTVPRRAPAPPAVVVGSAQQALINADRAAAGLPPLTWSSCLAGIAYGQSQAMAARGSIFHGGGVTQDFGCGLGSTQTGENVGYWSGGINDSRLNTMFMNSPDHRANIMGPYHYVGTAWVVASNGYGYVTVEFA